MPWMCLILKALCKCCLALHISRLHSLLLLRPVSPSFGDQTYSCTSTPQPLDSKSLLFTRSNCSRPFVGHFHTHNPQVTCKVVKIAHILPVYEQGDPRHVEITTLAVDLGSGLDLLCGLFSDYCMGSFDSSSLLPLSCLTGNGKVSAPVLVSSTLPLCQTCLGGSPASPHGLPAWHYVFVLCVNLFSSPVTNS